MKPFAKTTALSIFAAAPALLIGALYLVPKLWRGEPETVQNIMVNKLEASPPVEKSGKAPPPPPEETPASKPDPAELERRAFAFSKEGDLREGMRFFETIVATEEMSFGWMEFARRLAREAPEEGFRWLSGFSSNDNTRFAMLAFGAALHGRDSAPAMKLLEEMLPSGSALRYEYCGAMIQAEGRQSLDKAYEIIERAARSDKEKTFHLMDLALRLNGERRHDLVVEMAERSPGKIPASTFAESLHHVWKNDPAEAQRRLDGMNEKFVAEACFTLAELYGENNPELAEQWMASLPPGEAKDRSAAGLARALSRTQPLESVRWSVTIEREMTRAGAMSTLLGVGIQKDLEATREIVRTAGLSEAETAKWMDFIEKLIPLWLPANPSSQK